MNKKGATDYTLLLIIIIVIAIVIVVFYIMIFSPSVLGKILPKIPNPFG
jgi:uncharacterized protein (UPF0333 family)